MLSGTQVVASVALSPNPDNVVFRVLPLGAKEEDFLGAILPIKL